MAANINVVANVNTTQVSQGTASFASLKDAVKSLAKEIPGLNSVMGSVNGTISNVSGGLSGFTSILGGMTVAAIAATAAMASLGISMAFKYADIIDGFGDLAAKLNITATEAYFMSTAAKQAGGDLESLMQTGNRLSKAMAGSGDEMKGVGAAFARLGVDATDASGKLKSTDAVAAELISKWETSAKTASDYADMQQILGKNFEQMIPIYMSVKDAQDMANKASEDGIGITKQSLAASGDLEKQQLAVGNVFNSMGSIMVELVVPAFSALTGWFVRSYTEGGVVSKVFTAIVVVTEVVMIAIKGLTTAFMVLTESISLFSDVGTTVFKSLFQAMTGDFKGAKDTLLNGFSDIGDRLKGLATDVKKTWEGTLDNSVIRRLLSGESPINRRGDVEAPSNQPILRGGAGGSVRPDSSTGTNQTATDAEKADKAIQQLIDSLNRQAMAQENLNKVQLTEKELSDGRYKSASAELKQKALMIAATIDQSNANKLLADSTAATMKIAEDYIGGLKDEVKQRTMNRREYALEIELRKIDLETQRQLIALKNAGLSTLERETQLMEANRKAKEAATTATKEAKASDDDWFKNGMEDYARRTGTLNDALRNFTTNTVAGLSNAFNDLVTKGEFGFKKFAASVLQDLANLILQFGVIQPLLKMFMDTINSSSSGGGFGGLIGSIFSGFFAQGGVFSKFAAAGDVVSSPTTSFFGGQHTTLGEAGDEAIMPLKRNAAGDLGVVAAGGGGKGGTYNQVNNITVQGGGSDDASNRKTAEMIRDLIDKRWKENAARASRPGGMYNPVSLTF